MTSSHIPKPVFRTRILLLSLFTAIAILSIAPVGFAQEADEPPPPTSADADAEGHSPDCKTGDGSCTKNLFQEPLTRDPRAKRKSRAEKLSSTPAGEAKKGSGSAGTD